MYIAFTTNNPYIKYLIFFQFFKYLWIDSFAYFIGIETWSINDNFSISLYKISFFATIIFDYSIIA